MDDQELGCQIGLSHSLLSSAVLIRVTEALGSAQSVWEAPESALKQHLNDQQVERLCATRQSMDPQRLLQFYQDQAIQVLTLLHPDYPPLLRFSHDPPFVLYVRGDTMACHQRPLAVVGTRDCTHYGQQAISVLIEQLASAQPCIVSGLAAGIDTLAHQAALHHQLPTVAVFGTGIDQIYPRTNQKLAQQIVEAGGALMSELPAGTPGGKHTFPKRNRIIAGMSQGTLVVEGDETSGALITAKYALEENRHVMALPGSIFSKVSVGPNRLIQQGAIPVTNGADIQEAMGWSTVLSSSASEKPEQGERFAGIIRQLSQQERQILDQIGYEPTQMESIQASLKNISIMDLNSALTMLELQGLVTALPGAKYCRN